MKTRQQLAAVKAHKTIRDRKKRGLGTLKDARLVCKAQGHNFTATTVTPGDTCVTCKTRKPDGRTFAKLAFVKWVDDSWRALWRGIAVEMARKEARSLLRQQIEQEVEFEWRDYWELPALMQRLLDLAMVDHKLRNPRARGDRLWAFGPAASGSAKYRDVKCRFCGRAQLTDVRMGVDYGSQVANHTVPCALTSLATGASADPKTATPRRKS